MTLLRLLQCCHFDLFVYHVMCLLEILCLTVSASYQVCIQPVQLFMLFSGSLGVVRVSGS